MSGPVMPHPAAMFDHRSMQSGVAQNEDPVAVQNTAPGRTAGRHQTMVPDLPGQPGAPSEIQPAVPDDAVHPGMSGGIQPIPPPFQP